MALTILTSVGISKGQIPDFSQFFVQALQGDVRAILDTLDTMDDRALTEEQLSIKRKFISRFRSGDEVYDFRTSDTSLIPIIKTYQSYWRNALLDNANLKKYDNSLAEDISDYLKTHFDTAASEDIVGDFTEYLREYIISRGYYAATGRTGMFFDLLLHGSETETVYTVTTPEDTMEVKVVFMDDLISNGWEEYATFGKYFPGGWATGDALYCARATYDLESEKFKVSYLMHEGKHFADYKRFPKLAGADLEYRAKLVELSAAKETLFGLIGFFIRNAAYDKQNPHSFANFCVIRDLSRRIFKQDFVPDINQWEKIPAQVINDASTSLLKENTKNLNKSGSETVTEFIK